MSISSLAGKCQKLIQHPARTLAERIPALRAHHDILWCVIHMPAMHEDQVYFWRKGRKALKKSWKTGNNTEHVAWNRKMPFWSHGKLKKIYGKPEKAYFFCGMPETNPYSRPSCMFGCSDAYSPQRFWVAVRSYTWRPAHLEWTVVSLVWNFPPEFNTVWRHCTGYYIFYM